MVNHKACIHILYGANNVIFGPNSGLPQGIGTKIVLITALTTGRKNNGA